MASATNSRLATTAATAVGLVFIVTGTAKLLRLQPVVELFSAFKLPAWSLFAVGMFELVAAVLLLVPRTRTFGAIGVCATMAGASLSHVLTGIEQEMLLVDVVFFAISAWLVLRDPPALFTIDWQADPHGHPSTPQHHS